MSTKSVDWAFSVKLANNSTEIAEELLEMLRIELPDFKKFISAAFQAGDAKTLANQAHKLHGACCYCGVPLLKQLIRNLEIQAKNDPPILDIDLFNEIMTEIDQVMTSLNSGAYKEHV